MSPAGQREWDLNEELLGKGMKSMTIDVSPVPMELLRGKE
jgi:hypothetical protein